LVEKQKINMTEQNFKFRDPVVQNVCKEFVRRSDVGYEKYGRTLNDERSLGLKSLQGYLKDVQEELMDAILYIQTAREELRDLSEQALIDKFSDDEETF
jgi:hypothetical protein